MSALTPEERAAALRGLVRHLQSDRADLTPAEHLRTVRLLPGWACRYERAGLWAVEGDGVRSREVPRGELIPLLQKHWLPAAVAELEKETPA